MKVSDFDFELPKELIAQHPSKQRSSSRLMSVDGFSLEDRYFYNICDYFKKGDVLVINDTKVMSARLFGIKEETNAHVEVLVLKVVDDVAECLVGNARVVKVGTWVKFGNGELRAQCVEVLEEGLRKFKLYYHGIFMEVLDQLGEMPLPPYIHEKLEDPNRYQTVYSKVYGSAAAPTAGLHFTNEIINQLENKGVEIVPITLHVGLGTFRPVKVEHISDHIMHDEEYFLSKESAFKLQKAKSESRRITAVGTTSVRTLETIYEEFGYFKSCHGKSNLFITPGFNYKAVDRIITNFHLPKSTLLMLVAAFSGYDEIMNAYRHAVKEKYGFFSFGDSMILQRKKIIMSNREE